MERQYPFLKDRYADPEGKIFVPRWTRDEHGNPIINPEWEKAPYERVYLMHPKKKKRK